MPRMIRSLASKLITSLTVIVVLIVAVVSYFDLESTERQFMAEVTRSADQLSNTIVSSTWHAMLEDRRDIAYRVMNTIGRQVGIDKVRIINKEGRVTFSTGADQGETVNLNAEACDLCHASDQPLVHVEVPSRVRTYGQEGGHRKMGMVTPIYNESACSQASCHAHPADISVLGVLDITMSLDHLDASLSAGRQRALIFASAAMLLMAGCIALLVRRFVGLPVGRLITATQSVAAMDLEGHVDVDTPDEIGELSRSFNRMTERLKQAQDELTDFTHKLEQEVELRSSRLRETERRLIQSERMASLGQLAASVAHEINNPLSGVLNFAKLMQRVLTREGIPPERVDDFRRYLEHVAVETARCGRIVVDLLAFSRRQSPRRRSCDFNGIVTRTVALVNHKIELESAQATLELAPDCPVIDGDPSQLQQIVINLVMNAVEAMPEGGRITLRTRPTPDGGVFFEVEDEGVGIPEEILPRVFDPFFTTKEEGKGTGLGLAVVFGIVEAHGGAVEVARREGGGTCVHVSLPRSVDEEGAPDRGEERGG